MSKGKAVLISVSLVRGLRFLVFPKLYAKSAQTLIFIQLICKFTVLTLRLKWCIIIKSINV